MGISICEQPLSIKPHLFMNSRKLSPKFDISTIHLSSIVKFSSFSSCLCRDNHKGSASQLHVLPDSDDFIWEAVPRPILDTIESPMHLKNLTPKELNQLADEIRSELCSMMSDSQKPFKASVAVVDLAVAIHHVFHCPVDKILWDVEEQTYPHKLLTGRRSFLRKYKQESTMLGSTFSVGKIFDPFEAGHGCNSISAALGMAAARDIKGKRDRVVAVISNESMMAGQVYEAMSNAGYLDSNLVVILNDSRHSLHPKMEEARKTPINAFSGSLSKLQSSKLFRNFREILKVFTKKIGRGMHEWAAKIDEYARGMMGPPGSTLFEELGLYYIGPVDGHNIEDLVCVLHEVASLDSMGPVLVHVITKEDQVVEHFQTMDMLNKNGTGASVIGSSNATGPETLTDCFVNSLIAEAEKDDNLVAVHAGMRMEPALQLFKNQFPDRFFNVGIAEQHAVTFAAGLSCGGLKPFCIIPSAFIQRAYDQVVHDVDRQKIPVRFVITSAGLVGSDGPNHCGAFDITFMACLPNIVVMAPADEVELAHMVATAAQIDDRPTCFRYPRGAVSKLDFTSFSGTPIEVGKGRLLVEGSGVALLGYGSMVQNCLRAQSLLSKLGVHVTVADARFCKPLDIKLIRELCANHSFLITVEEGSIGGFGSHIAQFISLDGQLDSVIKWRPITLPDNYIERASPMEQLSAAGLSGNHIAATVLSLLGRNREALLFMC
ncbi:transferase [Lithospermum erythrorhizon]|uniref:1-deoxy-D-xylulose-5-phosphate synthase n=1 Tax=Lithospermum erythrorhizon TaxID=34254 RepID=A0AAV3RIV9_LITER